MLKQIRLLLIEDNPVMRSGIVSILKTQKDIVVLDSSGSSRKTMLKIHQLKPNVILLDIGLRSRNSLHVVEILKKEFRQVKIIIMDLAPVQADILKYVKAGANGFILKDASLTDLPKTIRNVSRGNKVLPPPLIDSLFFQIVAYALGSGLKMKKAISMTKREREVIDLLSEGMSNKDIAGKMRISIFTVKSHIHNIMEKIVLHTRLEIANYSFTGENLKSIAKTFSTIDK